MAPLERLMQLQSQGMQDNEIVKKLRDEGMPMSEISEAFNQAKIKQAVSQDFDGMQQSIMQGEEPVAEELPQEQFPQYSSEQYSQPSDQYQQEYYQPQLDTGTITEIADQVVSEKFAEFNKKTGDIVSFKADTQDRIKDLDERLKRIETSIDKIQQAILGKIGEYGNSMTYVHKDLENIHDTMSKLMNPLIDNYKELKKIAASK
jgi:hypothetical protein